MRRSTESVIYDILRLERYHDLRMVTDKLDCQDNQLLQRRELLDEEGKVVAFLDRLALPSEDYPFHSWQWRRPWGYFNRLGETNG